MSWDRKKKKISIIILNLFYKQEKKSFQRGKKVLYCDAIGI